MTHRRRLLALAFLACAVLAQEEDEPSIEVDSAPEASDEPTAREKAPRAEREKPEPAPSGAGGAWRIERERVGIVAAKQRLVVRLPNRARWVLAAPEPPDLPGQELVAATLSPAGKKQGGAGKPTGLLWGVVRERSPEITIELDYRVVLFRRRLVRAPEPGPRPPELSKKVRKRFLAATPRMNHDAASFRNWRDEHKLAKLVDEDPVTFARRAFLFVRRTCTYLYPPTIPRTATTVCREKRSDCGGLNALVVAILRSNGIPARLLVGRHAKSAEDGAELGGVPYYQWHVMAEFHVDDIGWVPFDAGTWTPYTSDEESLTWFGQDRGAFITMHVDPGVDVPSKYYGTQTVTWMQGARWWSNVAPWGAEIAHTSETWTVTTPAD